MSLLPDFVHPSWKDLLTEEFQNKLNNIEQQLDIMSDKGLGFAYFPEKCKIMRFIAMDVVQIKCVILGMEPYPSWYIKDNRVVPVATGRSFEIDNVYDWNQKFKQSSLRNILKTVYYNKTGNKKSLEEIRKEIDSGDFPISQPKEWFEALEREGVLFLNATLTVEPGNPDTHTYLWNEIMNEIISFIDANSDTKWLLFGNRAQERLAMAIGIQDNTYQCCHPRIASFVDENIFKNVPEIRWSV